MYPLDHPVPFYILDPLGLGTSLLSLVMMMALEEAPAPQAAHLAGISGVSQTPDTESQGVVSCRTCGQVSAR